MLDLLSFLLAMLSLAVMWSLGHRAGRFEERRRWLRGIQDEMPGARRRREQISEGPEWKGYL